MSDTTGRNYLVQRKDGWAADRAGVVAFFDTPEEAAAFVSPTAILPDRWDGDA